ncbi:MAG: GNAT family N-acetyltransferase [Candidatus Dormibacteria bacterium]
MRTAQELLDAYDRQLRTAAETAGALTVARLGPLHLKTFEGGRGFVTYDLPGRDQAEALPGLVPGVLAHFRSDPNTTEVEWKTRGHDRTPGLQESLLNHGFAAEERESIMAGPARLLDVAVPLPAGVTLRRVSRERDVRAMAEMLDQVFPEGGSRERVPELLRQLASGDGTEVWVAEAAGRVVSAGRLLPVTGSDFAGIWGGATLGPWRRRGIYRALTAARARSALRMGKTLIHSDSNEDSRPILERSGLVRISTTTPYRWRR